MESYINELHQYIPQEVLEGLLSTFCLGLVIFLAICGVNKGLRYATGLLLAEYIFLLFSSTVIYRTYHENQDYDFHPFWSYKAIIEGKEELIAENILNVVVFVPVGLLLGCAFRSLNWWKVVLIGGCISVVIEALQFVMKRGFSEVDDVIHNTLGSIMGFGLYKATQYAAKSFRRKTCE